MSTTINLNPLLRSHSCTQADHFISAWYMDRPLLMQQIIQWTELHRGHPGQINHRDQLIDTKFKDSWDWPFTASPEQTAYCQILENVVDHYAARWPWVREYGSFGLTEGINIQRYLPGQGFHEWHTERTDSKLPQCHRLLVFMTYLNTVTDGGETEFLHQKIKIKPEQGLTLVWPADWTHTHRGLTSRETKWIITGWLSYV